MSLREFFAAMAPFLTGRVSAPETVRRLYPEGEREGPDARRLWIYARQYQLNSVEMLDHGYPLCREVVLHGRDRSAWLGLAMRYFQAYPQRHYRYGRCSLSFPDYLRERADAEGFPPWLSELADLELWMRLVKEAPDDPADRDPEAGLLRLASTVELRDYAHDLLTWIDTEAAARPEAPAPARTIVLFWRDRRLWLRREAVGQLELLVLKAVREGRALDEAVGQPFDASLTELEAIVADLQEADVLLGGLPRPCRQQAPAAP